MKKTIFPFKFFWVLSPICAMMGIVGIISWWPDVVYCFHDNFLNFLLMLGIVVFWCGMFLGGVVLLVIARPITILDDSIKIGWLIRRKIDWNQLTKMILVNKGVTYVYLLSESTANYHRLITREDPAAILLFYYIGQVKILKPIHSFLCRDYSKYYNIVLNNEDLPKILIVIPTQNDISSWLRTKVDKDKTGDSSLS